MNANKESRTTHSIRNARVNLLLYALTIVISFFSRKVFLEGLGDHFVGLMSILRNILEFLNLAELGIGWAVGVKLYQPLAQNNRKEITQILQFCGYLYRKVGLIILWLGIIISIGFPWFFNEAGVPIELIYFCYYSFLISLILGYYLNFHQILLQADQKEYILATVTKGLGLIKVIIQIALVWYFESIVLWILADLTFGVGIALLTKRKIEKEYPWLSINFSNLNRGILKTQQELLVKVKQIAVHKFSFFVQAGTDQILIYLLVNIQSVTFFSNYQILFGHITTLINSVFNGVQGSIGNLVAEQDKARILSVYWEYMAIRFFITFVLMTCMLFLVEPFIRVWIGDKYILDEWVLYLLILNLFVAQTRHPNDMFINAYGLYDDVWAAIAEAVINLLISIIFGSYLGISGVVLGTFLSTSIIVYGWRPYYLFKNGFQSSLIVYWRGVIKITTPLLLSFIIVVIIKKLYLVPSITISLWIKHSIILFTLSVILHGIGLFICSKNFRGLIARILNIARNTLK